MTTIFEMLTQYSIILCLIVLICLHSRGQSHLLIAILRKGSAGMQAAWDTYGYVLFYNTRIYIYA